MKRFSVIFPTYNVASFLKEAILCIKAQTFSDWELIIVDDGSTDTSGQIADAFAAEDDRICSIHQKNMGVSAARNTGLDVATGEYILFLDPDDTYERTLLGTVDKAIGTAGTVPTVPEATTQAMRAIPTAPDIIFYSLYEEYRENKTTKYTKIHTRPDAVYEEPAAIHRELIELERETMLGYPWNKAYRLSYLKEHNVRFPEITHIEDILFNIAAAEHVKKIAVLSAPLYHYRNEGQKRLTGKYLPNYFELQKTRIHAFLEQQKRFGKTTDFNEAKRVMAGMYFRSFASAITRKIEQNERKRDTIKWAKAETKTGLYQELKRVRLHGSVAKILYAPLRHGHIRIAYHRAKLITNVRAKSPMLYAKLKQNR